VLDALIAGAGPAGAIAGLILARAGARVLIVDRESFPRDKLCGDTLNPGAVALLDSLGVGGGPIGQGRPLAGMLVTGSGATVRARYGGGIAGRAIFRRTLDAWLVDRAVAAGARLETGVVVRSPLIERRGGADVVRGVTMERRGGGVPLRVPAAVTIAADGRRSVLARAVGLSSHPREPRRWAFGVYASGIDGLSDLGEMHIQAGAYVGVAPIDDGLANVCVVTGRRPMGPTPMDLIRRTIAADPVLARRFADARYETRVQVMGPLAVDVRGAGVDGLLLAGDAAGFVDPMTGDGLRLAMEGARLAADAALQVLATGDFGGAAARLDAARRASLGRKLRFNRALRRLVDSPATLRLAGWGAGVAPGIVGRLVRYAGDAA
jgi:flavin-dependent dehydrogenase